jgi:hypothetical protein
VTGERRKNFKEGTYILFLTLLGSSHATDVRNPRFRQLTSRLLVGNGQEGGRRGKKSPETLNVMPAVLCTGNPKTKWTLLHRDKDTAPEQK